MRNTFLNNYFSFNRRERRIVVLLLFLCFLVFLVLFILKNKAIDAEKDYTLLDKEMAGITAVEKGSKAKYTFKKFDPNTVDISEMVAMGLREKDAITILKFRKYKPFYKPEDLKVMYFMTDELFLAMQPFIEIEQPEIAKKPDLNSSNFTKYKKEYERKEYSNVKPDINTADSTALKEVNGIGSYLAMQIVWYRGKLGWYESIEQLREVKGMREESYEKIKDKVVLRKVVAQKLNINKASWKEIIGHPYISKEQTNKIVRYKKDFGTIMTLEELVTIGVFTKEESEKLKPYLSFITPD